MQKNMKKSKAKKKVFKKPTIRKKVKSSKKNNIANT